MANKPTVTRITVSFNGDMYAAADLAHALSEEKLLSYQGVLKKPKQGGGTDLLFKTFDEVRAVKFIQDYAAQKNLGEVGFSYTH